MQTGIVFDIKRYAIHDGPGIRTTVFLKGCPMRCQWCHNPEGISDRPEIIFRANRCRQCEACIEACDPGAIRRRGSGRVIDRERCTLCGKCTQVCPSEALEWIGNEMSLDDIMAVVESDVIFYDESGGGVTLSGGEPLNQLAFTAALLKRCRAKGIHTALDTSGFCKPDELESLIDLVDLFLYDIKLLDDRLHVQYTGVSNRSVLENLGMLSSNGSVIHLRIPVIPGVNTHIDHVNALAEFIRSFDSIEEVDLLPYHSLGVSKMERLNAGEKELGKFDEPADEIIRMRESMERRGFRVRIGG